MISATITVVSVTYTIFDAQISDAPCSAVGKRVSQDYSFADRHSRGKTAQCHLSKKNFKNFRGLMGTWRSVGWGRCAPMSSTSRVCSRTAPVNWRPDLFRTAGRK